MTVPPRSITFFTAFLVAWLTSGGLALSSKPLNRQELASKAAMAIKLNAQAEQEIKQQMQIVLRWAVEFKRRYGHYPQTAGETRLFTEKLGDLLPANPFLPAVPVINEEAPLTAQCINLLDPHPERLSRIHVYQEPLLSASNASQMRTSPPDTWPVSAGDITLVTGNDELCLVLAGGADGRPVRDQASGQMVIYIAN